jgi:biopolymer transport protein TolR
MLVLLIIFMVTAPLITPRVVDLPSVGKASKQPDVVVQVVVGKNDQLELKSQDHSTPVTLASLAGAVRKAQNQGDGKPAANTAVVISADKTVQYERVVKVMDTLQRAGFARIGLSVQLAD